MVKVLDSNSRDLGCIAGRINVDKCFNIFFYQVSICKIGASHAPSLCQFREGFLPLIRLQQAAMHNPQHR